MANTKSATSTETSATATSTTHSKHYNNILFWYKNGNWPKKWVHNAVTAPIPWLTADEYKEITGEDYVA